MKLIYVYLLSAICITAAASASEITIKIGGAVYASGNQIELIESTLPKGSNLLDALAFAGGASEAAALKTVHIKRAIGSKMERFEVDAIKCLQDPAAALLLKNGDMIWVPEIIDGYPAPHYFNRLLFEWKYLKSNHLELPSYWINMVQHLDRLGHQKKTKFKEWSEPVVSTGNRFRWRSSILALYVR
jgi:hypothetical protein